MATIKHELEKLLKQKGYKLVRSNKHQIFSNGKEIIIIPNSIIHNGAYKKTLKKLKENK